MHNFNNNHHQYSTYLNENSLIKSVITSDELDLLADNPQSNLNKILQINNYVRYFINKDDLIGKVFEAVENNVNTDYKLSYQDFSGRNKIKQLEKAKELINQFNEQINLKKLIKKTPQVYSEGNYPLYLRISDDGNYIIDHYPLGVIEVSDYDVDGEPVLLVNINELKRRLQKTYTKNKKGKFLFYGSMAEEIEAVYPKEVYEAFINKESYAKLDPSCAAIMRVNNLDRKYGVTSIFKALKSALMLETYEKTDRVNAKAKAKKIIFQKLTDKLLGQNGDRITFEEMAYAHESFMGAFKNETVVYTGAPFVEEIKYIEPTVENVNIDNVNYYRSKIMTLLGIGFLNQDSKQTFTVANISIGELMKQINKITEQLQDIVEKWYKVILKRNGIPLEYCPKLKVIDSEQMTMDVKKSLVEILYSKLNCSLETAYGLLGIDIEDEKQKRKAENDEKLDEIFTPRQSIYTTTDSNGSGRPTGKSNNPDKTLDDQDRRGSE